VDAKDVDFAALQRDIADELVPYGPYLAMRGAQEDEQRLGIAALALAALFIAAWAAKQYLAAYLQEKGRQDAAGKAQEPDSEVAELREDVKALIAEIRIRQAEERELQARWENLLLRVPSDSR
jgi:hypothetical protein